MKTILLTGMSGTGKSTIILELRARGYRAVDADEPAYSEDRMMPGLPGEPAYAREWVWREDAIEELLSATDVDALFLGGCARNQVGFYDRFDAIILLTAPIELMLDRLRTRTNNNYGKHPDEVAQVLHNKELVEPLLRRDATIELDTSAPIDGLIEKIIALLDRVAYRPNTSHLSPLTNPYRRPNSRAIASAVRCTIVGRPCGHVLGDAQPSS